jgi:hypothetical protein
MMSMLTIAQNTDGAVSLMDIAVLAVNLASVTAPVMLMQNPLRTSLLCTVLRTALPASQVLFSRSTQSQHPSIQSPQLLTRSPHLATILQLPSTLHRLQHTTPYQPATIQCCRATRPPHRSSIPHRLATASLRLLTPQDTLILSTLGRAMANPRRLTPRQAPSNRHSPIASPLRAMRSLPPATAHLSRATVLLSSLAVALSTILYQVTASPSQCIATPTTAMLLLAIASRHRCTASLILATAHQAIASTHPRIQRLFTQSPHPYTGSQQRVSTRLPTRHRVTRSPRQPTASRRKVSTRQLTKRPLLANLHQPTASPALATPHPHTHLSIRYRCTLALQATLHPRTPPRTHLHTPHHPTAQSMPPKLSPKVVPTSLKLSQ